MADSAADELFELLIRGDQQGAARLSERWIAESGIATLVPGLLGPALQRFGKVWASREALTRLATLAEAAPVAVVALDLDCNVTEWNPAAERIFGWSRTEALGRPNPIIPEESWAEFLANASRALAGEPLVGVELVRRRRDGSPIVVRVSNAVVRRPDGEPTGFLGILEDVTREKQLAARTRQLLDVTLDGYILADGEGRILEVNPAYCKLIGYSRDELAGMTIFDLEATLDADGIRAKIADMVAAGSARFATRHRHKQGAELDLDVSFTVLMEPSGPLVAAFVRDVTEQREVEQALQASERRYRSLFEGSPVSLWEEDASALKPHLKTLVTEHGDGLVAFLEANPEEVARCVSLITILDVNRATVDMFGATDKAEAISQLPQYFGEQALAVFRQELVALARGAGEFTCDEVVFEGPAGPLHAKLRVSVATGSEDDWSRLHVAITDVTSLLGAERALAEADRQWRTTFDAMVDPVFVVDREQRVERANQAAVELLARPLEELLGQSCYALVHGTDGPVEGCPVVRALASGASETLELAIGDRWFVITADPVRDESGAITSAVHSLRDITERKRGEEALRRSRARLETLRELDGAILEARSVEAIASAALERLGGLISAQRASVAVFEQTMGEATVFARGIGEESVGGGKRVAAASMIPDLLVLQACDAVRMCDLDIVGDLPEVLARLREAGIRSALNLPLRAHDALLGSLELGFDRPDGFSEEDVEVAREVADSLAIALAQARLSEALAGHARELEARVAARTAALEAVNLELDTFAFSVSHDLRSQLRAVDGFGQVLEEELGDRLDGAAADALTRIRSATGRMGEMTDALLQLSRATRADMLCEQVDLSALAKEIAAELGAAEPQRRIEIEVEPGLVATGAPALLRAMLTNLLANAVKFTRDRDPARIQVGAGRPQGDGGAVLYVKDNGVGFDMAHAGRLFGPFQRLHREAEFPGLGIGLATVQRIVARHGGRVWAEAEPGKGATFFVALPPSGGL